MATNFDKIDNHQVKTLFYEIYCQGQVSALEYSLAKPRVLNLVLHWKSMGKQHLLIKWHLTFVHTFEAFHVNCPSARRANPKSCYFYLMFMILKSNLTGSFHKVKISEPSKKLTGFMCDNKIYEINVVPFGIKTGSAGLIRGLDLAVADLEGFLITLVDDLLCLSNDFVTRLKIPLLFDRLSRKNLRLNFRKSNFVKNEINF